MRGRLAVIGAVGALLAAVAWPAGAVGEVNALAVGATGTVAKDGTVTLSGSYRCAPSAATGEVLVSSKLKQGAAEQSIGGTVATCDGLDHSWTNSERADQLNAVPGPAEVEATLLNLDMSSGLPLPQFLAVGRQSITLSQGN
ncbi:DUF6299 family protein [Kitasatospora sp. NPDC052896]|uniref:DUF6299 family protein n=1 Tax=Kitasatospora sp. NPDC052896 TaxID=3364061 RepID=UPI0037C8D276